MKRRYSPASRWYITKNSVLVAILIVALIASMVPMASGCHVTAATSTGVPASSYDETKEFNSTFTNNRAQFSVVMKNDGYINYSFSGYSSQYKVNVFEDKTNKIIIPDGAGISTLKNELFLKKGTYIFVVTKDEGYTSESVTVKYSVKYNAIKYIENFINGPVTCNFSEGEHNNSEASATPIKNFGIANRYIGNFGGYSSTTSGQNSDVDFFQINLQYRAPLEISISSLSSSTYKYDVQLYKKGSSSNIFKKVSNVSNTRIDSNILSAGTYYLVISSNDNYQTWGQRYSLYVNNKGNIAYTNVAAKYPSNTASYTGKPISFYSRVEINLLNGSKALLKEGIDYKVVYSKGNTKIGSGTMYIKGINGFTGTRTLANKKYTIKPAKSTIASKKTTVSAKLKSKRKLTINWKKISTANYYQIKYRVKGTKKWNSKTVSGSKTSYTLTKLKKGKKYQYRVRGLQKLKGCTSYYSKYSKTKTSKKIK